MFRFLLPVSLLLFCLTCQRSISSEEHSPSEAGESLRLWAMARTFPDGHFHTEKYAEAMAQMRLESSLSAQDRGGNWEAIGPKNIGGRTLCLAVHPLDSNIIFAGSASGGLWKTTTAGRGAQAWTRVETGFPVLGVSAIAIDPKNPQVLYIGTGEVYNVENSMPNVAFRTTRGTYGIGILKSTDGGATWSKSLDWAYGEMRGVQDIKINPLRPATVFAATTEGLLRSRDAGASWQTVHNRRMAVDIEINPLDTNLVFVTHGLLDDQDASGIFRSTNGGNSFQLLNNGIATVYSGKALLGMSPSQPNVLYASVGNAFEQEGLYKTTDNGTSWALASSQDICTYQGWYSHDVAVDPTNPNAFIWVGIDAWISLNGGLNVQQKTYWSSWTFGQVPVGGPEGPSYYVHADIHRVYWSATDPGKVYCVTDGGIFVSYDGGVHWEGRNGGYQTQQFYANMGNSTTNPNLCIGGMQDNATAIYTGDDAWTRVIGGDGECAAIHPQNDQIMYASYQNLNISKSVDGGQSFYPITSDEMQNEARAFNGPFEIAADNPDVMYAGAQSLFRSDDGGESWNNVSNGAIAGGNLILTIAIDPQNSDRVYCSTAASGNIPPGVYKFNGATGAFAQLNGLPNRICMDVAVDPAQPNILYAVFSGFNTGHVWKSTDGGTSWVNIDHGLPDVPTNTLLIDPKYPDHVYVGNDLGVWLSRDAGNSWTLFSADAPKAMLVMHLSATPDRKLRVATYGLGVWQAPLEELVGVGNHLPARLALEVSPNPAQNTVRVQLDLPDNAAFGWRVVDSRGRVVARMPSRRVQAGPWVQSLDCSSWPPGAYGIVVEGRMEPGGRAVRGSRVLLKQ